MILAQLSITDYKQFAGEHVIIPDSQGIIAVVGANGSGKTTLFEAIEWCLYGPRTISNADVFPRGRESKPRVQVILEHPVDGRRYVIERSLSRSKTMKAQVWREDDPETILATGSAPVRAFVSDQLVGLRHDAFVSTFFTRQKELTFFGSMRPTERRVMVGRLLGVEAVRLAQESIGLERSRMATRAEGLAAQVEQEQHGINFDSEIERADERAGIAAAQVASADAGLAAARQLLAQANERGDLARNREQQDRQFGDELGQIDSQRGKLHAEQSAVAGDLERLEQERIRRDALALIATDLPSRQQSVGQWRDELDRRNRRNDLLARQEQTGRERSTAIAAAEKLVRDSKAGALPEWTWDHEADALDGIDTLLEIGAAIDVPSVREEAEALKRLLDRLADQDRAKAELDAYQRKVASLRAELGESTAEWPIDPKIERADAELAQAQARESAAATEARKARDSAQQLLPLIESLTKKQFGDHCPTCGRDIEPGQAAQVISALQSQVAMMRESAANHDATAIAAQHAAKNAAATRTSLLETKQRVAHLETRIESGLEFIQKKAVECEGLAEAVADMLRTAGRKANPSTADLDVATARATELNRVSQAMQGLVQRRAHIATCNQTVAGIISALDDLGKTSYDESAHRAAETALDEATNAAAGIAQIDRDLSRVPDLRIRHQELGAKLTALAEEQTGIAQARAAFGFDSAEISNAREAVAASAEREREAATALFAANTTLRDLRKEVSDLKKEQTRLADLFEQSLKCRREADELDRMYREFAAFDQFVASRIAPRLAEQTSELLALVTDGKYDKVEFDDDYGIKVFDGYEEKFPLGEFSGGERDIVSLCARLALSQVIGSAAQNPPSFLVLDEAFGALDRDRRAQLLDLLGQLSEQTISFQQMFVISHVDDVRASPIFSRVLRITEDSDGCSRIEDVTTTGLRGEE